MNSNRISRRETLKSIGTGVGFAIIGTSLTGGVSAKNNGDEVKIVKASHDQDLSVEDEHCKVSSDVLDANGVSVGEQVRVGCDSSGKKCNTDYPSGLYTVVGTWNKSSRIVLSDAGMDRIGFQNKSNGWIKGYGPNPDYDTIDEADANDEYVEILEDDCSEDRLVATAVHGGWIEHPTHKQSEYVANELGVTEWTCAGFNSGGGAYDRWHITSTDIHRDSFPGLDSIGDRGFDHCVSFHGFSNDGIAVGGGADKADREEMRDEIDSAVGSTYDVYLADPDGAYAGDSSENFCDWLTANDNGIQLEIGWDARQDDWDTIADAVVSFYDGRI